MAYTEKEVMYTQRYAVISISFLTLNSQNSKTLDPVHQSLQFYLKTFNGYCLIITVSFP
jgi:hypothetical protein